MNRLIAPANNRAQEAKRLWCVYEVTLHSPLPIIRFTEFNAPGGAAPKLREEAKREKR